ncbi:MAG TPA: hypothetical protein VHZ51_08800 [Ktedonobacteraceae bacterium]|nr:hypothetical protein [Ktedonobacteraceae bacterium]
MIRCGTHSAHGAEDLCGCLSFAQRPSHAIGLLGERAVTNLIQAVVQFVTVQSSIQILKWWQAAGMPILFESTEPIDVT